MQADALGTGQRKQNADLYGDPVSEVGKGGDLATGGAGAGQSRAVAGPHPGLRWAEDGATSFVCSGTDVGAGRWTAGAMAGRDGEERGV